jgi:hypothetical protein
LTYSTMVHVVPIEDQTSRTRKSYWSREAKSRHRLPCNLASS